MKTTLSNVDSFFKNNQKFSWFKTVIFLCIPSLYLYSTHYHFHLWLPQFLDQFLILSQNQLELDVFLKDSVHIHVHQNYALLDSNFGSIHKIHFTNSNQMITKIIHFSMWNWKYMTKNHLLYCFKFCPFSLIFVCGHMYLMDIPYSSWFRRLRIIYELIFTFKGLVHRRKWRSNNRGFWCSGNAQYVWIILKYKLQKV